VAQQVGSRETAAEDAGHMLGIRMKKEAVDRVVYATQQRLNVVDITNALLPHTD
jgi:hypothetical protein